MLNKLYNKHRQTGQHFLWRTLQIVSKQGTSALIFFIAAGYLSPEEFGIFSYLMAVIGLLMILCDFGFSAAISRFVTEYEVTKSEKLAKTLFSISVVVIGISAFISILVVCLGRRLFDENHRYVIYLLPCLFLMPLAGICDGIYRGLKQFKKLALVSSCVGVVSLAASFFLVSRFFLVGAILSQSVLYLLMTGALFASQRGFKIGFDRAIVSEVAKYAFVLGITSIAYFLYSRIDILILKQFDYVEEIGYYEIINKVFQMLLIPFAILGQVVAPNTVKYAATDNFAEIKAKLKKYIALCLTIGVVLGIALRFAIPPALRSILPQYHTREFMLIMNILLILLPFKMLGACMNQGFIVPAGFAKILAVTVGIGGVLNVVFDYICIDYFGYTGVFWVTLVIHSLSITTVTGYFLFAVHSRDGCRLDQVSNSVGGVLDMGSGDDLGD